MEQLPRAFVVSTFEVLVDDESVLKRLVAEDFDPAERVLLERQPNVSMGRTSARGRAEVLTYHPEHVRVAVETRSEAFLVLSDTFYPGWRAYVDGEEVEIFRANYLFRAVRVPRGSSSVEFRYSPLSYRVGKLLSVIGVIAVGAVWWFRGRSFSG